MYVYHNSTYFINKQSMQNKRMLDRNCAICKIVWHYHKCSYLHYAHSNSTYVHVRVRCLFQRYLDDIPPVKGELYAGVVFSERAHANILSVDAGAALAMEGVVDYVCVDGVPGNNMIGTCIYNLSSPCLIGV